MAGFLDLFPVAPSDSQLAADRVDYTNLTVEQRKAAKAEDYNRVKAELLWNKVMTEPVAKGTVQWNKWQKDFKKTEARLLKEHEYAFPVSITATNPTPAWGEKPAVLQTAPVSVFQTQASTLLEPQLQNHAVENQSGFGFALFGVYLATAFVAALMISWLKNIKSERFTAVDLTQAQQHRLYGVGGWLIVYVVSLILSVILNVGSMVGTFHKAGLEPKSGLTLLFFQIPTHLYWVSIWLWTQLVIVAFLLYLVFTKNRIFRAVAICLLLLFTPASVAIFLTFFNFRAPESPLQVDSVGLVQDLLHWIMNGLLWGFYLWRSERVRVTFEHQIKTETNIQANHQNSHSSHSSANSHPLNAAARNISRPLESETPKPAESLFSKPLPPQVSTTAQTPVATFAQGADDLWESAMAECTSGQRKAGLWARCFAETDGDENKAQARYIKHRVAEEQQRVEKERKIALLTDQAQAKRDA